MEKLTTPEFDNWVKKLLHNNLSAVISIFRDFKITVIPTPQNIMLAAIQYKEPFVNQLTELSELPEGTLYADGKKGAGLLDYFVSTLSKAQNAATAAIVFNKAVSKTPDLGAQQKENSIEKEEKKEDEFSIFGAKVPKLYVYISSIVVLIGGFFVIKRFIK